MNKKSKLLSQISAAITTSEDLHSETNEKGWKKISSKLLDIWKQIEEHIYNCKDENASDNRNSAHDDMAK